MCWRLREVCRTSRAARTKSRRDSMAKPNRRAPVRKSSRTQRRSWRSAFACVRERPELPGCGLHFVDPEGVVLLVVIAVELGSSIQLRCPHVEGIEATIDKRENVVNAPTNAAIRSALLTTCPPEN